MMGIETNPFGMSCRGFVTWSQAGRKWGKYGCARGQMMKLQRKYGHWSKNYELRRN
jgi:hypothetical protein